MLPALFVSHGSPMLVLTGSPARDFLRGLGRSIGRPSAIVVASAHWETRVPAVNAVARNVTIHDFYGFPPALFAMRYEPPGAPDLARQAAGLLAAAGLETGIDPERGLDHGAWVPLSLMYPEADIPVLQVGIQSALDPSASLAGRPGASAVTRGQRAGDGIGVVHARFVSVAARGGGRDAAGRCGRVRRLVRRGDRRGTHGGPAGVPGTGAICGAAASDG